MNQRDLQLHTPFLKENKMQFWHKAWRNHSSNRNTKSDLTTKISFPFLKVSRKNKQLAVSDIMPAQALSWFLFFFFLILCIPTHNSLQVCSFLLMRWNPSLKFSLKPGTNASKHTHFSQDTQKTGGLASEPLSRARQMEFWSYLSKASRGGWPRNHANISKSN